MCAAFEPSDGTRSMTSDRKSTRLNSSHSQISYAVFCLKKINTDRHSKSETITRCLLDVERIEGDELRRLLGVPAPAPPEEPRPLPHVYPPQHCHTNCIT